MEAALFRAQGALGCAALGLCADGAQGPLLFYFETAESSAPKGCIYLKSSYKIVAEVRKDPHVFEIRPAEGGERVWVISAPTKEDKEVRSARCAPADRAVQEWITALAAAMKLHTASGNNHTKEMLKPFTRAGYMEKEGAKRKNWKRRFFVLKVRLRGAPRASRCC